MTSWVTVTNFRLQDPKSIFSAVQLPIGAAYDFISFYTDYVNLKT